MYPTDLKYTKDHEWLRVDGGEARRGHHRLRAATSSATWSSSSCPKSAAS